MADVRALLKAKRQEVRITHPYAAYGAGGALRCTACGATVKFASAWEGHLGSKAHRVAVAKLRAQEEKEMLDKRGVDEEMAEEEEEEIMMETVPHPTTMTKRQRTEEREDSIDSRRPPAFPADFFSDPERASLVRQRGDDDDDDNGEDEEKMDEEKSKPKSKSQFDTEWAAFERDMQQTLQQHPSSSPSSGPTTTFATAAAAAEAVAEVSDPQERYARATIAAEPELVPQFEGLPVQQHGSRGVAGDVVVVTGEQGQGQGPNVSVSAEEERRRRQLEEHELIMDRLLEEERAQEEADSRVAVLKSRVEMLKKKRQLARGKKADAVRT